MALASNRAYDDQEKAKPNPTKARERNRCVVTTARVHKSVIDGHHSKNRASDHEHHP